MLIFLSYAKEDRPVAEAIAFAVRQRGHKVFLDRDDLPPGEGYDQRIEQAIRRSDAFVFLVSPDSVTEGRFTLTELVFARQKWSSPHGRVLPVVVRTTDFDKIPAYLKAVTLLEPAGNAVAETSAAVDALGKGEAAKAMAARFAAAGALSGLICAFLPVYGQSLINARLFGHAVDIGIVMGLAMAATFYVFAREREVRRLTAIVILMIPLWLAAPHVVGNVPWFSLSGERLTSSDLKTEDLAAKLDAQTYDRLRQSVLDANYAAYYKAQIKWTMSYAITGILFNAVLLAGLGWAARLPVRPRDLGIAALFGILGGTLFGYFYQFLNFTANAAENAIVLWNAGPYYDTFSVHSWPALIACFMSWHVTSWAAAGYWAGRYR